MKQFSVSIILFFSFFNLSGQSFEQSITMSRYSIKGVGISGNNHNAHLLEYTDTDYMLQYGIGYAIPIYSPSRNTTFGINAGVSIGRLLRSRGEVEDIPYNFCLPVTATFRYGAGSNRKATFPIGVAVGAGYIFNTAVVSGNIFFIPDEDKLTYSYIEPYVFAEIVFDFQKRNRSFFDNFKIQIATQALTSATFYYEPLDSEYGYDMNYSSISFIFFNPFH